MGISRSSLPVSWPISYLGDSKALLFLWRLSSIDSCFYYSALLLAPHHPLHRPFLLTQTDHPYFSVLSLSPAITYCEAAASLSN